MGFCNHLKILGVFSFFLLLSTFVAVEASARGKPGKFDYYSLAISWSPTFCLSKAGKKSKQQCLGARRFAFVVHGLWPQYNKGWPQHCRKRPPYLSDALIRSTYDITPSKKLIIHEWKKHGTCTGLSAEDYFSLARNLFQKIKIPARYLSPTRPLVLTPQQLIDDFIKTNSRLSSNMISVQCGNSTARARLREIRICFTRQGNLRNCGPNEARRCRATQLTLPPVR